MIEKIINIKKLIPNFYVKSIYDIDFNKLYDENKRLILTDLDNTLVSYDTLIANEELINFIDNLKKIGFEIIIVSNNSKKRVKKFALSVNLKYYSRCLKPFSFKLKKAMKNYKKEEVIVLGDQLLTDVYSAKKIHLDVILVKAIKRKTEKWTTKNNRRMERKVLNKINKKEPEIYTKILKEYKENNYGN